MIGLEDAREFKAKIRNIRMKYAEEARKFRDKIKEGKRKIWQR